MKEKLSVLWAYITSQQEVIQSVYEKILRIEPVNDDKLVHSAWLLHNLYSAYEDIFKEISYSFENNIEGRLNYHKNLLLRMKIDIPGIRPKLLCESSYIVLGELMGFRHVFRHAYNYDLAPDKLKNIREKVLESKTIIDQDLQEFKKFLQENYT
jgi:hypothetical protein